MQNNDFDRFFKQALENQPEPEYNPADWDMLEDRLHNLHGSQPNLADKVVSGGSSLGKLGFAATAILVTAINVAFFSKPELLQSAKENIATVQNAILSGVKTDAPALPATPDNTQVAIADQVISTPENAASEQNNADLNHETTVTNQALPAVENPVSAPVATLVRPAAATVAKNKTAKNYRNTSKPASGFTWTPTAAGRPSTTMGAGLAGGKPTAVAATPCNIAKPEITALAGSDTIRNAKITLTSCQTLNARFQTKEAGNNNVAITSNVAKILPGARLTADAAAGKMVLQWQPKPEMARQQPYMFSVTLADSRCPESATRTYNYAVTVTPAFTAAISGNTKLGAGEGTTLEVTGAPAGASYQWLVGKNIVAEKQTGKLVIMPLRTTTYRVQVTSPEGCSYTDSVKVEVAEKIASQEKSIPNVFTPNGDGVNEYFEVTLPEEGAFDLVIFDRYGKQVYSRKNYDNRWNAANLENGTYYYIITTQQAKKTYKGWVEVLR